MVRDQVVVVTNQRIATVGPARAVRPPKGTRTVDARGKFVIPGLWDMHVHETAAPGVPPLHIANGVTGIRDMYAVPGTLGKVREAIADGRMAGPRIVASGGTVTGPNAEGRDNVIVTTADQARAAVGRLKSQGVEFIKVYNQLPRAAYFGLAEECRRLGLPFAGHTPDAISTTEAANAGQRSIEHLDAVLLDCSRERDSLRWFKRFETTRIVETFDPTRAQALFAVYRDRGTWHCPTLTVLRAMGADATAFGNPNFRYLPSWKPRRGQVNAGEVEFRRAFLQKAVEVTGLMYHAGVRLLAGTDTGFEYVLPGFSLHEELELFVKAGIPPAAVLRIATLGAAEFLGRETEMGTVTNGKLADLVLLDADPLASISNARTVRAVIADGRYYDRAALDAILARSAAATR